MNSDYVCSQCDIGYHNRCNGNGCSCCGRAAQNIIHVNFRKGRITLAEAKEFLGPNYFRQALTASFENLNQCINRPDAILSGASEAYEAVFRFRKNRETVKDSCSIIEIDFKRAA